MLDVFVAPHPLSFSALLSTGASRLATKLSKPTSLSTDICSYAPN